MGRDEFGSLVWINVRRPHLYVSGFLLEQKRHAAVSIAPASHHALDGNLLGEVGDWHGHIVLPRQFCCQADVLARQGEGKARGIKLAAEDRAWNPLVQTAHTASGTAAHALPQRL